MIDEFDALDLWPGNMRAWLAWMQLSRSRPSGFGAGAIPLSEILAWFQLREKPMDELLVEKIQIIDDAFLADQGERAEKKRAAEKRPAPPRGGRSGKPRGR